MGLFRRKPKDDFKHLAKQQRRLGDEQAWFEGDDDGPVLDVETGIGSNLRPTDDDEPTTP